jgi:3'(2'), 5'-bisphosphate nucleotidase
LQKWQFLFVSFFLKIFLLEKLKVCLLKSSMFKVSSDLLEIAIIASIEAGKVLLEYYNNNYLISHKKDNSQVTEVDKKSEEVIVRHLRKTNILIISEEDLIIDYQERIKHEQCWLVDPLDGTKEFIGKNGEFTVNIALIKNTSPLLGVVYSPLSGWLYFSSPETGSIKILVKNSKLLSETITKLPNKEIKPYSVRVVVSRSHLDEQTENFLFVLKEKYPQIEIIKSGSSIKLCKIAEGEADIYPRFGKTMEWDTAAGHAILLYANSNLYDINTLKPLTYNKYNLENPSFIAIRNNFSWY